MKDWPASPNIEGEIWHDVALPLIGGGVLVVAARECDGAAAATALAARLAQLGMRVWMRGAEEEEDVDTELA